MENPTTPPAASNFQKSGPLADPTINTSKSSDSLSVDELMEWRDEVRRNVILWLECFGYIMDKAGQIIRPKANEYQRKIVAVYRRCQEMEIPCRIVALKPRQKGSSTISVGLIYTHLRNFVCNAMLVGNKDKTTQNLMGMLKRYNDRDKFPWENSGKVTAEGGRWSHESKVTSETAGGSDPGRSGTFQVLLGSEVAHWAGDGVRSATLILNGLLNCVPFIRDTLIILESTAKGASGEFYEKYQGGVYYEDFMSGKQTNGYVRIFSPWYEFADSEDNLSAGQRTELQANLTKEEVDLLEKYNLRLGHIAFRRRMIRDECSGDPRLFDQEYPSNDEDCFLTSGQQRFDAEGIRALDRLVRSKAPANGMLEVNRRDGNVIWRDTDANEAVFWCWEAPKDGCAYLLAADTMTGEQATGKDPDCHSVGVIRAPYVSGGLQRRAALVARIAPPCRFDIDILADMLVRLSRWYGDCLIIPEVNGPGLALIQELKHIDGLNLYRREELDKQTSTLTEILGWQTKDGAAKTGNRSMLIEKLASIIREQEIDVWCPHVLSELKTFVTINGKAQASPGKHDDDVLMLGIGMYCLSGATVKVLMEVPRELPGDLKQLETMQPMSRQRQFS